MDKKKIRCRNAVDRNDDQKSQAGSIRETPFT